MDLGDSTVVGLNRAVARSYLDGPAAALADLDAMAADGSLDSYPYLHAARADLLRRLNRRRDAINAYGRATQLCHNPTEREFLERRKRELTLGCQPLDRSDAGR